MTQPQTAKKVKKHLTGEAFVKVVARVIGDPRKTRKDLGWIPLPNMLAPELAARTIVQVMADEVAGIAQRIVDSTAPDRIDSIRARLVERADRHEQADRPLLAAELRDIVACIDLGSM